MADINLYSEFTITMTGPALGLLLIYLGYRGRLLCVRRSMAKSTETNFVVTDAETGQDISAPTGAVMEQYALSTRRTRDLAVRTRFGAVDRTHNTIPTLLVLRRSGSPSAGSSSSTPFYAGQPSAASRART